MADETAKASNDMMENLIRIASELNLTTSPQGHPTTHDDDFGSIGYSFEHPEPSEVFAPPPQPQETCCSH